MVTRAGLRYTRDSLTPGICSLIKPAAMEKLISFPRQNPHSHVIILYNALCTMHAGGTMHCKPCYKLCFVTVMTLYIIRLVIMGCQRRADSKSQLIWILHAGNDEIYFLWGWYFTWQGMLVGYCDGDGFKQMVYTMLFIIKFLDNVTILYIFKFWSDNSFSGPSEYPYITQK